MTTGIKYFSVTLTHCWAKHFQSVVEHMLNRWVTGVKGYLFMSLFHQSLHRWVSAWWVFCFFFCCWKLETLLWWCLLFIPHIFFTFMLLHLIFFLCIELDKWSKRFPGIRNHWCIFKVTFAVLLCCYGIVCTWLHDSSVAKLWIFYTSSKQLWEGRSNWSWAEWRDRKRCPVYGI